MKRAEELGISENIDWLPFLPREVMVEEITSSDYFVLLSDSEAYGISVAEAISLAHDLGHSPFGHYGETILDELLEKFSNYIQSHNEFGNK